VAPLRSWHTVKDSILLQRRCITRATLRYSSL
jgi:hypothetical protein